MGGVEVSERSRIWIRQVAGEDLVVRFGEREVAEEAQLGGNRARDAVALDVESLQALQLAATVLSPDTVNDKLEAGPPSTNINMHACMPSQLPRTKTSSAPTSGSAGNGLE